MQRTLPALRIASRSLLALSSPASHYPIPISGRRYLTSTQPLVPEQPSSSSSSASTSTPSASSSSAPPPSPSPSPSPSPYFITRTEQNASLPVYSQIRNGGTKREILVRYVTGDLQTLKDELVDAFGVKVQTKERTGTVVVSNSSGRPSVQEIKQWLEEKGF